MTEAGVLFWEDARTILRHLDRATEAARRVNHGETARLRLAFVGALLDEKLIQMIQRFRTERPVCQVEITDLPPAAQLAAIQAGEIDGGFVGAKPARPSKGLAFADWNKEPLLLVLPQKHPINQVKNLQWHHLKKISWVMVSRRAAPAFRQQFSRIIESHSLSGQIVQESDRVPAVLTMVAAGSGVTLAPQIGQTSDGWRVIFSSITLSAADPHDCLCLSLQRSFSCPEPFSFAFETVESLKEVGWLRREELQDLKGSF